MLTVTDSCGNTYTDDVRIDVCDCFLNVPTSFTPNGDGLNDVFTVQNSCGPTPYEVTIYNRWGEVVFNTKDLNQGWDGTYHGAPAPQDVYGVKIHYGFIGVARAGDYMWTVTLIR
jgi:gliding motility-associated-like protein